MHQDQYSKPEGYHHQPPYNTQQQQYYQYGYTYPNYQQQNQPQQQPNYGTNYSQGPPPPPPPPPSSEVPPPPPGTDPPLPPGTNDKMAESSTKQTTKNPNYSHTYSSSSTVTPSTTATTVTSSSNEQSNVSYPCTYWGAAPTSTTSYWSNQSNQPSNWTYSNWYQVPQSQQQDTQAHQQQQTSSASVKQYNYAQYGTSGGNDQGWSHHTPNQSWGWGGWNNNQQQQTQQQQNPPYQQNQWGNQQWGGASQQGGGASKPGSEAWVGGWSQTPQPQHQQKQQQQQHSNYQQGQAGGYYNQSQQPPYQYGSNYQGQPHGNQTAKQLQQPSVDRPSRSPGTPPLQELLSPRVNEAGNERGTTPGRKHPPPSGGEGEPESKRARQDPPWQAQDRYPPLKRVLLPTPPPPPPTYNAVPPPGASTDAPPATRPPPPTSSKPEADPTVTRGKFPPGFSTYVNRAFAACSTSEEREKIHEYLDVELNKIFNDKKQWEIDWETFPLPKFLLGKKRPASRWDTPSPSTEVMTRDSPITSRMGGVDNESGDEDDALPVAFGRGRGKKRKKNKGKNKGKNSKFFIDNQPAFTMSAEDKQKMSLRTQRFGRQGAADGNRSYNKKLSIDDLLRSANVGSSDEAMVAWQDHKLQGTSQSLEKQYLRLTSAPDPSTVRPLSVLRRAYDHVLAKWESKGDYRYTCEQFKSIRQDLTIQTIRNDFTVLVYETHARIALRNSDRGEFNQCQTQLKALYHEGTPGHQAEFIAYRILYLILTDNTADLSSMLKELTSDLRHSPCVDHALRVHSAWFLNNYHKFFKLYRAAPNLSGALMDLFLERERKAALKCMAKAYVSTEEG